MRNRFLGRALMTVALLAGAGIAGAMTKESATGPRTDAEIAKSITHEVRMYPRYTIWDDVNFSVVNGQVELSGAVSQPFKKADLERLVRRVPGVTSVKVGLKVLPLSPNDDRLRLQVARAIYGHPAMTRYAMNPLPSIHIIVENGRVTLTGVVANQMDRNIAGLRASGAGLAFGPVVNNLEVENRPAKKG
jgi:hyperosmotically inducible protein